MHLFTLSSSSSPSLSPLQQRNSLSFYRVFYASLSVCLFIKTSAISLAPFILLGALPSSSSLLPLPSCQHSPNLQPPFMVRSTAQIPSTLPSSLSLSPCLSSRLPLLSFLIEFLREEMPKRILFLDGAMGTQIQDLKLDEDAFRGSSFFFPFPSHEHLSPPLIDPSPPSSPR